ncbi:hypothetical protein PCL_07264 [Purpureocillium lilacinum]|uniref:Uncharacterized protein n=1 Tax=Purpureocillium lilacinum TaxID=33203 RepID=A0A2U3DSJ4_PURLI|nr:hypothetical protein PCL_07264 [Purpureocillium lilacinum]
MDSKLKYKEHIASVATKGLEAAMELYAPPRVGNHDVRPRYRRDGGPIFLGQPEQLLSSPCDPGLVFADAEVLFQERAIVLFYTWLLLYPPVVGFLSRRLPASHFVRSLTWSISDVEHTTKGRDMANSLWVVLAAAIIAKYGKPLRPALASRVAASVHVSFATWLHGDGQFCRADHCGVAVAASSARAINIQTRTKVAIQGAKTYVQGCWFVQFLHVDGVVRLQTSRSLMWSVPRRSRKGFCRLSLDYGNGGHCAKPDKQITVHTRFCHILRLHATSQLRSAS